MFLLLLLSGSEKTAFRLAGLPARSLVGGEDFQECAVSTNERESAANNKSKSASESESERIGEKPDNEKSS